MNEFNTQQVERLLQILALVCPFAGLAIGILAGIIRRRKVHCTVCGLVAGLVGTAVFGLWRVFYLLGQHTGFAGVGFVSGQVVLFLGIGLIAGVIIGRKIGAHSARKQSYENVKTTQEDKLNA